MAGLVATWTFYWALESEENATELFGAARGDRFVREREGDGECP